MHYTISLRNNAVNEVLQIAKVIDIFCLFEIVKVMKKLCLSEVVKVTMKLNTLYSLNKNVKKYNKISKRHRDLLSLWN